jgi:hypothetical protein
LIAIITVTIVKIKKSQLAINKNFIELGIKIPLIKDVIVLEKLGGGSFGDIYHGLVNVSNTISN